MNIVDAMTDASLFGSHFRGSSWQAWRVFLSALFGLPITDDDAVAVYLECTGRTPPVTPYPSKIAALVVGRRGGKSLILALVSVFLATFRDYSAYLAPGEVGTVAILAADRRQARSIFRYVAGLLESVPMLAAMIEEQTTETVTLNNRVVIEIATASFRVTRGYTFVAVLADEVAFWRTEDSVNPDREIIAALRPGLATIPGSMLLLASSPYRKRGVLWDAFAKNFGRDDGRGTLVWRAPTATMNPRLDPQIIADAYEEDAESAAAEYGAEFRSDLSDFVQRSVVEAATPTGRAEIAPMSTQSYVAFVDPSGGSADSMTLGISHREGERVILDAIREVKPPFSPEQVTKDFADLLKSYRIRKVCGDRYAGEWPRERFRVHGISYELSDEPKSEIYLNFLPVLNSGRAQLLALPRLQSQLLGLERRTGRSGRDSIDHAPGGHDDVANAAAGALLLAAKTARARPARSITLNWMGR